MEAPDLKPDGKEQADRRQWLIGAILTAAQTWASLNPRASMHTREYLAALVRVELMGGVMEVPAPQR